MWIVRYLFRDRNASMEIKILVWSSRYFFEDCETSEDESWGILLRSSRDSLTCREKVCPVAGYFRFIAGNVCCFAVLLQFTLSHSTKRKRG